MLAPSSPNTENSSQWRKDMETKANPQIFLVCTACCSSCRRIHLKFTSYLITFHTAQGMVTFVLT